MGEGNSKSKSRAVLGDVTNTAGKRGISWGEKSGEFYDKDGAKRMRSSPRFSAEINSLKRDVVSDISRIQDENESPNVAKCLGGVDVGVNCSQGNNGGVGSSKFWSEGENFATGISKIHGGSDDITILGLGRTGQSQTNLGSAAADGVGNVGKIGCLEGVSTPLPDKIGSHHNNDSNWVDVGRPRGDATPSIAYDFGKLPKEVTSRCLVPDSLGLSNYNDHNKEGIDEGNAVQCANIHANSEQHDRFAAGSSGTVSKAVDKFSPCGNSHTGGEENKAPEGTQDKIMEHDDQNANDLILSQQSSVNSESTVFLGTDAIRDCSCPFCTKATQIWFDLNEQDIKGRISAIRKSQKEATALAERSCKHKVVQKHGGERIAGVANVESNLRNQWRGLFQGMVSIWDEEVKRLENSLETLAGVRGKCKDDLGSPNNTKPSEEH